MTTPQTPRSRKPDLAGLRRWVPRLIFAAATAHMIVGAGTSGSHWRGIVSDGLWNTVANEDDARMATLWFMMSGVGLFGLGLLTRRTVIDTSAVPAETGWILLALGIPVSLLEPVSGGWLLIAIGFLSLAASRRKKSAPDADRRVVRRAGCFFEQATGGSPG